MNKKNVEYPLSEYFLSIQGEGSQSGKSALFLRFGECNLDCPFCDTKDKIYDYQFESIDTINKILEKYSSWTDLLVLTGGEPLIHDLKEIIKSAKALNYRIAVETNGTIYKDWIKNADWVTVSPKISSDLSDKILKNADELKFVITKNEDISFMEKFMPFKNVFLMPVDNDKKIADMIINYLKTSKYRTNISLGIQLHKVYNIK